MSKIPPMASKPKKTSVRDRVELARHISVPVLLLMLLTLPWFFGGREPFGHLLTAGLSLLLYLSWLIVSRHRALRVDYRPILIIAPLAGLIVWSALSLIWTVSAFQSLSLLATIIEATLAFVVARDVLHEDVAPQFFMRLWMVISIVVWLIGAGLFVAGDYDRMTSLFYWANPLATYLLVGIITGLHIVRESSGRTARLWLVATGALASGLILTYSRAAWLVFAIGIVAALFSSSQRRAEARRIAQVVLIAASLSLLLVGVRQKLYQQPTISVQARISESPTSTSVSDRLQYWQEASALFSERPVTGWGVGSYSEVHPRAQLSATTAGNNPHNSFLQSLVELGMVGGVAYLILIGGWLWRGWQILQSKRSELALTAWLVVTAIGLHSWLDLVSNYPVLILAGAIWLALALPAPRIEFRLKRWSAAVPLVAGGLAIILSISVSWNVYASSVDAQLINATAGDFDSAAAQYERISRRRILDPDLLTQASVNAIDQFDLDNATPASFLDQARSYAVRAVALEPQDARHVFGLANVLERQGKVTEALANYRQAVTLDPHNNPQYQIAYARLLQREGFVTEAIVVLRPIMDEYTQAVIDNRSAIPIGQRVAVGQAVLADLYTQKNDLGRAQAAIERAIDLSPDNPFVLQVKATYDAAAK